MLNQSLSSSIDSSGPPPAPAGRRIVPSSMIPRRFSSTFAGNRLVHSPALSPLSPPSPQGQSAATLAPPLPPRNPARQPPSPPSAAEAEAAANAKRRRRVKAAEEEEKRQRHSLHAAQPKRRTIPSPPHRQLFLVDGLYCGADPSGYSPQPPQQREPPLSQNKHQKEARDAGVSRSSAAGAAETTSAAAAVSNRVEMASRTQSIGLDGALTANNTFTMSSNGVSFYVSPSVPPGFQLVNGNHNSNSRGVSPTTTAPPAALGGIVGAARSGTASTKPHTRKKLRVKRRFYEPVELQVESLSSLIIRLVLVLWYACLLTALVIEVIPRVQWSVVNLCGSTYPIDLHYIGKWASACVTSSPSSTVTTTATNTTAGGSKDVALTWTGRDLHHLHSNLVRYRRIVISLPTPADQAAATANYPMVVNTTMESEGMTWFSVRDITLHCQRKNSRCDTARVPEDVLAETSSESTYRVTLLGVPASLAVNAAAGALGIAYQRSSYTVATIVWRYVLLLLSFLHTLRFIVFRKFTSNLYEQGWTLALQIALMWYLDPLFALDITTWPMSSVLAFLEYRVPTYFVAVMLAYMLSVMTASMAWPTQSAPTGPQNLWSRLKAFLVRSRNVYDPPMWTKITVCVYLACVFVLDVVDACVEQVDSFSAANSNVRFRRIYWSVIALLLFGGLVCLLMLMYLRSYLGNKPYLESRPQQLACRVFLMIFLSAIAYYILHCLVFFLLYNRGYSALASQQPFLQLPTLMVASFFVNIMTLVYTSQNRDHDVPINPKDQRWKHMVWPDTWYSWLARHGGSQYVFATEVEEMRFYRLQFEFRKRQFLAKQKRRQQPGVSLGENSNGAYEQPAATLGTQRDATHSGLLSLFRTHNTSSGTRARQGPLGVASHGRDTPWRREVWETPMPSQPGSPVGSEPASDPLGHGAFSGSLGDTAVPGLRDSSREEATRQVRGGGDGAHGGGEALPRTKHLDHTTLGTSANMSSRNFSAGNRSFRATRQRDGAAAQCGGTPLSLAALSVLNMDRFSTYFLADEGNNVSGGGGYGEAAGSTAPAPTPGLGGRLGHTYGGGGGGGQRLQRRQGSPSQSSQRERSSAFDAYDIEGPAHRRSRLHQASSAPRQHNNSVLRQESTTMAEQAAALSRTFEGSEARRGRSPPPLSGGEQVTTPLLIGSGIRGVGGSRGAASGGIRHARSHSDGDVPSSAVRRSQLRVRENSGSSRGSPSASPPRPPTQHHQDPMPEELRRASSNLPPTAAAAPAAAALTRCDSQEGTDPCFTNSADATGDSNSPHLQAQQSEALLYALRQVQQDSFVSPDDPNASGSHALPTFPAVPTTSRRLRRESLKEGSDGHGGSLSGSPTTAGVALGVRGGSSQGTRRRRLTRGGSASAATSHRGGSPSSSSPSSNSEDDVASDLYGSDSSGPSGSETSSDDSRHHGRTRHSFFHTLNVVRERLGAAMRVAEKNIFEKPARGLDRFEMQIFAAAYRPFQSMHYLPFFNLETAVDCFNISWEAYGVEKSLGDDFIETGIKMTPQNVPKTVAHGVKKVLCGCCAADEDSSDVGEAHDGDDDDDDTEGEKEDRAEAVRRAAEERASGNESNGEESVHVPQKTSAAARSQVNTHRPNTASNKEKQQQQSSEEDAAAASSSPATPAAAVPGSNPPELTEAEQHEEEMLSRHGAATVKEPRSGNADNDDEPPVLHHKSFATSDDAVVIVHMSGEGKKNNVPKAEHSPEDERSRQQPADAVSANAADKAKSAEHQSAGLAQGGAATTAKTPNATIPAVATDPNFFPINVEKYGFTLLLVAEAKDVQVIMVKMDTSAPEHRGKAPRIIIGFRGTANMSNAKYDMNIQRVVWREMERVEEENNADGTDGTLTDMASSFGGASTMETHHLGCGGCLRACMRASSWRPTCHAGFLSIWKTLRLTVLRRLREVIREDRNIVYRIFTTGHSLGGALASLSAYTITAVLRRMDYPIPEVTVYTYGQPRLGNRAFQRIYNKAVPRSFRVVNESDVIVSMTMFGGYHVGIEVDVDRNGNYIVKPTEIEKLFPPTTGRGLAVINHLMTNYGISLNAIASRTACPARGLMCYSTADPEKIARETAKEEALKSMQDTRRPIDTSAHVQQEGARK